MRYRLLGDLEVRADDGTVVTIPAPKRRALLVILLLRADRAISAEALVDALWGPDPPPAAIPSLHAHISRLRREIGPQRLLTVPTGYQLVLGADVLDIREFGRLVGIGRLAMAGERWEHAAIALRSALDLWRGDALGEFADQPFAIGEVARLDEARLGATEDRIDADLVSGRTRDLPIELHDLVREHPYRERLWRQYMTALYLVGRQAEALGAYRELRGILLTDLGIDPAPETQRLEASILRQDDVLEEVIGRRHRLATTLPNPVSTFIGRGGDIQAATATLAIDRLVTLIGVGGVGKTRLAIEVARRSMSAYPDGVVFVDLATTTDPTRLLARIGEELGGGDRPADVIGDRRMLAILDNFEQIVEAAGEVAGLLERCPGLRVIVTSRVALRVRGERRLAVDPLPADEAAALFDDRAGLGPGTSLTDPVVGEIVGSLDHLPLAVELAAARVPGLARASLRDLLADRLDLLDMGARDAPARHRSLSATIAWSFDLLSRDAQSAFPALAILSGSFDLGAALAVGGCDVDIVAELVDHSLLQRRGDRYAYLDTIRAFAMTRAETAVLEAARDRRAVHFMALAASIHRLPSAASRPSARPWHVVCTAEREHLRDVFDRAADREDADTVVNLFRAVGMYWLIAGAIDVGNEWSVAALAMTERLAVDRLERRAQILMMASEFPRFSGDLDRALALKHEALELVRRLDQHDAETTLLDDIASITAAFGDDAMAQALLRESLALQDQRGGDALDRAHTIVTMAEVALQFGRIDDAILHVEAATRIEAGAILSPDWVVESTSLRAKTLLAAGAEADAAVLFRSVVRDATDIEFRMPVVDALDALAAIHQPVRPADAARLLGMADRVRAEARLGSWDPGRQERVTAAIRGAVGEDDFRRLHAEGHAVAFPFIPDAVTALLDGA